MRVWSKLLIDKERKHLAYIPDVKVNDVLRYSDASPRIVLNVQEV